MSGVIFFNVLVQLLANALVLHVHFFFGFPPGMGFHPILYDACLITRRHVYEFFHVFMHVVLDPFVAFDVHGLALGVRAMNGALMHIHHLQIVGNDGPHPLHNPVCFCKLQILQRDFQRFHEIAQLDRVLALRVQKHLHVELRVVVNRVVRVCDICNLHGFFFYCFNKRAEHVFVHGYHGFHKLSQFARLRRLFF